MCIRDSLIGAHVFAHGPQCLQFGPAFSGVEEEALVVARVQRDPVSYTHLRAHETVLDLVCRLLLEKKKTQPYVTALLSHNTLGSQ